MKEDIKLSVRVSALEKEKLAAAAAEQKESMSYIVRLAIKNYLAKEGNN